MHYTHIIAIYWFALYMSTCYSKTRGKLQLHWMDIFFGLGTIPLIYIGSLFKPLSLMQVITLLIFILLHGLLQIRFYSRISSVMYGIAKLRLLLYFILCAYALWLWQIVTTPISLIIIGVTVLPFIILVGIKRSLGSMFWELGVSAFIIGLLHNSPAFGVFGNLMNIIATITWAHERDTRSISY